MSDLNDNATLATLLDLGSDIADAEVTLSRRATELLYGQKVVAIRILFKKRREIVIKFENGTSLLIDNFASEQDISIV